MTDDVVISGAGPAGSALAIHLARAGLTVRLLDRARFPRDKACGEFLSPAATPLLEALGVRDAVDAAGARRIDRVRITAHGEPPLELTFPADAGAPPWGYALSRLRLDAILLEAARAAGAQVEEGVRVEGLVRAPDGAVTGVSGRGGGEGADPGALRTISARVVVGAGGRNCPVARALGLQQRCRQRRVDLLTRWSPDAPDGNNNICELFVGPQGYVAAAPLEGGRTNVNCVVPQAALRRTPDALAVYRGALKAHPPAAGWAAGRPDGDVIASDVTALTTRRATADGVLLVGDSALFLDPFTGQGIYLALRSATLAAEALLPALANGRSDRVALAPYDAARAAEFGPKRSVSRALQAILFRRPLAIRLVRACRRDPALATAFAAVTGDLWPARRVWSLPFALRLAVAGR